MKYNFYIYALSYLLLLYSSNLTALDEKEFSEIPIKTAKPNLNKVYPIAIVGAGAAGTMAVMRAVLNNNEVLLFSGAEAERHHSRGNWVRKVENIPGLEKYERVICDLRDETLENLVNSSLGKNLFLIEDSIMALKKDEDIFKLTDNKGNIYSSHYVVLATGIMDEQPLIQGSISPILKYANGQAVGYCLLCDGHRCFGKKTVVIGYTDEAAKGALLLSEKYQLDSLILLTNGQKLQAAEDSLNKMKSRNIRIEEAAFEEIEGDTAGKRLQGFKLVGGSRIDADMAFILLGIRPNNQLALQLGAEVDARGLVITNSLGESSIPNLFVDGDLRAGSMKQIYTAWQQAVDSLQVINKRIREKL